MKKSELCKMAQLMVLRDTELDDNDKLDIIQYLHDREGTELTVERVEARESLEAACKIANGQPKISVTADNGSEAAENAKKVNV